ncbi:MAG: hypothetical protein JSR46_09605 [Verrucomicrobia bacterium]|nr:hypothetical protein [Verrucomicrobiota bacterium]
MNRLSAVRNLTDLVGISRHHPRKALECMESFGIGTLKFRDICKTCSKNMGIKDKFAQF